MSRKNDKVLGRVLAWGGFCLGALSMIAAGSFANIRQGLYGPDKETTVQVDERLPKTRENQTLMLHPKYLNGSAFGYTLLTDMDYDGTWDLVEEVRAGFTPGDYSKVCYFKKGFGPSQHLNERIEFVEPDFFKPYQR